MLAEVLKEHPKYLGTKVGDAKELPEWQIETMDDTKKPVRFQKGDCLYIPAGMGRCYLRGEAEILKVRC